MTRAALVVPRVRSDPSQNLATVVAMATQAAHSGADLVIFPEAVLTGLINNDDPAHDLALGQQIPGPSTETLGKFCRENRIWLAFGLLERESNRLYDSAVLIDASGGMRLKYRRNQPQWHGTNADSRTYCQGTDVLKAETTFGSVSFLICGDLFDDGIVSRLRDLQPDWLLFPFSRSFPDGSSDQGRWDREELPHYLDRVGLAHVPTLMTNYIGDESLADDNSFGGAFFVSDQGELLGSLPLGQEGFLMADLEERRTIARRRRLQGRVAGA